MVVLLETTGARIGGRSDQIRQSIVREVCKGFSREEGAPTLHPFSSDYPFSRHDFRLRVSVFLCKR